MMNTDNRADLPAGLSGGRINGQKTEQKLKGNICNSEELPVSGFSEALADVAEGFV